MNGNSLLQLSSVSKKFGTHELFRDLSINIHEKDKIGILGPNGSGKSTLMKIIAGFEEVDSGTYTKKKDLRVSYITQSASFNEDSTVLSLVLDATCETSLTNSERERVARTCLATVALDRFNDKTATLSGGQKKKLQLAIALAEQPDLLLLDEPTNHLDIESIIQLEQLLQNPSFSWVCISHDRWFLENTVESIIEINSCYPQYSFRSLGGYHTFLKRREDFLTAQESSIASLSNKVRTEKQWLNTQPKARGTKAKGRKDKAEAMIDTLALMRKRTSETRIDINFNKSERKTKKLLELHNISKAFDEHTLFSGLSIKLMARQRWGILGNNGSGKSTLIKLLTGVLQQDQGSIKRADNLSIAHFRQVDTTIDYEKSLKHFWKEDGDAVVYLGREININTWAKKFGFDYEHLHQPFGSLSGGEQARARIAKIMLEPSDVLILDEPTNDLDIDTLELLEESLEQYGGTLILVTHDRFMIHRLCTHYLGLDGRGSAIEFGTYEQWQKDLKAKRQQEKKELKKSVKTTTSSTSSPVKKKKLSYMEQREYDGLEEAILIAEEAVTSTEELIAQATKRGETTKLTDLCETLSSEQAKVESLYARWEELEAKQN